MRHAFLLAAILTLVIPKLPAAEKRIGDDMVRASLLADVTSVEPGQPFRVGVRLIMKPGWHTYWKDPGDAGLPTEVEWKLPPGFSAGALQWPAPEQFIEPGNILANVYVNETILTTVITPPNELTSKTVAIKAKVNWLVCEKACYPGEASVSLSLPTGKGSPAHLDLFDQYKPGGKPIPTAGLKPGMPATPPDSVERSLLATLLLAVIGGLILNVFPCVLPVISLKIFSIVREAHNDPKKILRLGLIFSLGILVSFWILAGVAIALRSAGQQIGWGFQLQNPYFLMAMCVVVLVFGLSLLGVFEFYLPGSVASRLGPLASKSGDAGAFFNGFLATVLATPCTAPFLAPAVGYAFSKSALEIFLVFTAIAVGLASPYLLLSARPGWLKYLPKPGPWMERVKQFMGFLLLATLLWLLWVLGGQAGYKAIVWAGAFLLMVGIGCWVVGNFATAQASPRQRATAWIVAVAALVVGWLMFVPRAIGTEDPDAIRWQKFSLESLEQNLAADKTVFLDFSAEWCLTCKVNEYTVLDSEPVRAALRQDGVVPMKADWTRYDPVITEMLAGFGRSGVPFYVVYPGAPPHTPIPLPDVITTQIVLDSLAQATGRQNPVDKKVE